MILKNYKRFLTVIGARMSPKNLWRLQMCVNYMGTGKWMYDNGFEITSRLPSREAVYDSVLQRVRDEHVLYLEFGVYKGESMRYWADGLKNPESNLHGFDSFEGLPEDWDIYHKNKKGDYSVGGVIPKISDKRVKFFKGWFDSVLPGYQLPDYDFLVINLDADLYSSTKYVLDYLRPVIRSGVFIYFDDMNRPDHEPKAFREFMDESGLNFRLVAADCTLRAAFFECVG